MLDRRSPLADHAWPGHHGPHAEPPAVMLGEQPLGGLAQIAGWPTSFEAAVMPALSNLGFAGVGDFRSIQIAGEAQAMRIAPHCLLLRHPDPTVILEALSHLDSAETPTLDLSSARIVIRIEGPCAEQVMRRLSSVDFGLDAFPVSGFVQTGIHHVGVLVQRLGPQRFDIFVPTTWALSLWDMARESVSSFGCLIGPRQGFAPNPHTWTASGV